MHQVGLAQPGPPVDHERVERGSARVVGDSERCCARELVAVPLDEIVKGIPGIEITLDWLAMLGAVRSVGSERRSSDRPLAQRKNGRRDRLRTGGLLISDRVE